ncbi:MAG: nitronate monooxygenase [Salinivirgaceae bacterium]|jgi:enoyl-[acyl-carrier protein] reductase II|nr:nitronate monooxygenase [Salinivirgaceae bacterium]
MQNKITELFNIKYPIIQGGMVWCSGWELASAVSNAGGLGLIGSGSMHPETLKDHIQKTKKATDKPFGVNVPLLYSEIDSIMEIIMEEKVPIVFTSAGNPKTWTKTLQSKGIIVAHVISNTKFALRCEEAGVNAIVAEGFEAGGHNGREETTTMCLIPQIRAAISTPLIAAGGIGSGQAMAAAIALGADGVQIGSLFAASQESSCHDSFKQLITEAKEGDTKLSLKKLAPTRLLNNEFYQKVLHYEIQGASPEEFKELLGTGRAKKGMFEGDLEQGELEIGQVSALIDTIKPISEIINKLVDDFNKTISNLNSFQL